MERDTLVIVSILAAVALGLLAGYLWPARTATEPLPVTCTSDAQCGGTIELERFCTKDGLFAHGQRNVCIDPGTPGNRCETLYEPWKVADDC